MKGKKRRNIWRSWNWNESEGSVEDGTADALLNERLQSFRVPHVGPFELPQGLRVHERWNQAELNEVVTAEGVFAVAAEPGKRREIPNLRTRSVIVE
jgi:hypothetical protein